MNHKKVDVYCTYQAAPEHHFLDHPESPRRLGSLGAWLSASPYPEMQWLDFTSALPAEVSLIHKQSLLEDLTVECAAGPHQFEPAPTYVTGESLTAALGAVGATLAVSRRILAEGRGRGFAIVRPPGHHAEPEASMGFCLLNNIAIAAADAVASGVGKVAIFDFDAHHGNGTEAAFWDTPEVAYCSTHEGGTYPGTGHYQSAPQARGRIVDIPLPAFSGNKAFQRVLDKVVEPWLVANQPEMLFVSAGFDAHFSDPLTTLSLDTHGFYEMSQRLVRLAEQYCEGRILYVLEGGYDPVALQDNIQATLAAFCGQSDYSDHYGKSPDVNVNIDPLIESIRALHHVKEN